MNINEEFPGKYLKSDDLQGKDVTMTIAGFERDDAIGKPIVKFQGTDKMWALNKTNALTLAAIYGDEMDNWVGQKVQLFSAMVDYLGKTVPAIRCRVPTNGHADNTPPPRAMGAGPGEQAQREAEQAHDMGDEIPF